MNSLARPMRGQDEAYVDAAMTRWGWGPSTPAAGPVWLEGAVLLMPVVPQELNPEWEALINPTHPILTHAETILKAWPEMYTQCQTLLDVIYSGMPAGREFMMAAVGGTCGPGNGWGEILVVSNNPVGYAEGVVHELGHHKLRALGIDMEEHDGKLLMNDPEELYESGVRKDKLRPMSAVLHAHYSYLHVTECELRAATLGYDVSAMMPFQLKRLSEGWTTITRHARWTAEGVQFARDLLEWTTELLQQVQRLVPEEVMV